MTKERSHITTIEPNSELGLRIQDAVSKYVTGQSLQSIDAYWRDGFFMGEGSVSYDVTFEPGPIQQLTLRQIDSSLKIRWIATTIEQGIPLPHDDGLALASVTYSDGTTLQQPSHWGVELHEWMEQENHQLLGTIITKGFYIVVGDVSGIAIQMALDHAREHPDEIVARLMQVSKLSYEECKRDLLLALQPADPLPSEVERDRQMHEQMAETKDVQDTK